MILAADFEILWTFSGPAARRGTLFFGRRGNK